MPDAVRLASHSYFVVVPVCISKDAYVDAGPHGQYSSGRWGEPGYGTVSAVCIQQPCLSQQSIL